MQKKTIYRHRRISPFTDSSLAFPMLFLDFFCIVFRGLVICTVFLGLEMERKARSMDTLAFIDFRRDVVSRLGGARSDMMLGTSLWLVFERANSLEGNL